MRQRSWLLLALIGGLTVQQCGGADYGDMVMSWRIGNDLSCEAAGVEIIHITLADDKGAIFEEQSFSCTAGFDAVFQDVAAGSYFLTIDGLSADDAVLFTTNSERVTVAANQDNVMSKLLQPNPGSIKVEWYFRDASMCRANFVSFVSIEVWDEGNSDLVCCQDQRFACDDAYRNVEAVLTGNYSVRVEGLDDRGVVTFTGNSEELVPVSLGKESIVRVALEPK